MKRFYIITILSLLFMTYSLSAGCNQCGPSPTFHIHTLKDVIEENYPDFFGLLETAQMINYLLDSDSKGLSVFIPSQEVLQKEKVLSKKTPKEQLQFFLSHHLSIGTLNLNNLKKEGLVIQMLNKKKVTIKKKNGTTTANDIKILKIIEPDKGKGMIIIIDGLLQTPIQS